MSKLPSLKPREIEKILVKAGFQLVHQRGSHKTFFNKDTRRTVTVPYHSKDIAKGTLYSVIKQSGLSQQEFIKLR